MADPFLGLPCELAVDPALPGGDRTVLALVAPHTAEIAIAWDPTTAHASKLVGHGLTAEAARQHAKGVAGRWWTAQEHEEIDTWAAGLRIVRVVVLADEADDVAGLIRALGLESGGAR